MYNPETDCVEVNLDDEIHISFNCQKCNASVCLNEPSDIAYLLRLAREEPGLYAKLASRDGGLQGYVEAMGSLIRLPLTLIFLQSTLVHHYLHLRSYNNYQIPQHLKSIFYLIPSP